MNVYTTVGPANENAREALRDAVRQAVEAGLEVQQTVRRITLQALSGAGLDISRFARWRQPW